MYSNPLPILYISELSFSESGFSLELYRYYQDTTLDGWALASQTDTVAFKSGINWREFEYTVVTNDDLIQPLNLRRDGDILQLISPDSFAVADLKFGNIEYSECVAPRNSGESISCYPVRFYYLDTSPTMGFENDTSGAMGQVTGVVTDTSGHPIAGAEAYIGAVGYEVATLTDSIGRYKLRTYAACLRMNFLAENYINQVVHSVQIMPDSTTVVNVRLASKISAIEPGTQQIPRDFYLAPNYPNPFNASTRFTYSLPKQTYITVGIYDLQGRLVERIFKGKQRAEEYSLNWDAKDVASGVYLYRVTTPNSVLQRKCTVIK